MYMEHHPFNYIELNKLEHSKTELRTHTIQECTGDVCPIHKMTNHGMRHYEQHWRSDRGIMERICEHGVGHPDPDHLSSIKANKTDGIHGCDGCCGPVVNVQWEEK